MPSSFERLLRQRIDRRQWLRASGLGLLGASVSGWLPALAASAPRTRRHCILLWMNGGPSQLDTFDPKPGHENGGPFSAIATNVEGIQFAEHLPKLATMADKMAVIRSMSTKEGDHGRASYLMRTGYRPGGAVEYPTLGSLVSKELGDDSDELPNFVSIAPYSIFNPSAYGPGFLGPKYGAAQVGSGEQQAGPQTADGYASMRLENLRPPGGIDAKRVERRAALRRALVNQHPLSAESSAFAHELVYERAARLMRSTAGAAFDLDQEPAEVRDAYGRSRFGQGCLLARRLVERGVRFVEVTLGGVSENQLGWDTHINNFTAVRGLSEALDAGWSSLMRELNERGLLESTTILWMGEFGRTPRINPQGGRDHFNVAWSSILAGGGIRGGQAYGRTSADGMQVADNPVDAPALLATLCSALGIDPAIQNVGDMGRPIRIADGQPIAQLLS